MFGVYSSPDGRYIVLGIAIAAALTVIALTAWAGITAPSAATGVTYANVSHGCTSTPQLNSSGLKSVCTTTFRASRQARDIPYYLIFSTYRFDNGASASAFLSSLSHDINTTPWFPDGSGLGVNATYTTLLYRNFGFTTNTEASLSVYVAEGNAIFSASTSNLTASGNLTALKLALTSMLRSLMAGGQP